MRTVNEHSVSERVHCPDIWSPVSMAKTARKWEQALEDLLELSPKSKWPKCTCEHCNKAHAQLDAVEEADGKVRKLPALT